MTKMPLSAARLLPWLLLLGSCGSPPKPPAVDESRKRPANAVMAVDLQVCKHELQNARIVASESGRMAEAAHASVRQLGVRQQADAMQTVLAQPKPNSVYTVRFAFGSTRVLMPAELSTALIDEARSAPLILLRGRTDGSTDSLVDSQIARQRALAMRDHLVGAGIDTARIAATWQASGDHAADNDTATGRAVNRRVEIEVYRAMPVPVGTANPGVGLPFPVRY